MESSRSHAPSHHRQSQRQALFVGLCVLLAGCTAALPPNTPPADIPGRAPQFACDGSWDLPNGSVTVRILQGPTYEPEGSELVAVRVDDRDQPVHWVGGPEAIEARQDPPLGPGTEITVGITEHTEDVRVIWEADRAASSLLCELERPGEGDA